MKEVTSFIYSHIRRMDSVAFEIRKNLCNMHRKKTFDEVDLMNLNIMLRTVVHFQAFIHNLPDDVEADLKSQTSLPWMDQKERIAFQLECTRREIMSDLKTIKHLIEKENRRVHDEALLKKLEQIRLKRAAKADEEGSN